MANGNLTSGFGALATALLYGLDEADRLRQQREQRRIQQVQEDILGLQREALQLQNLARVRDLTTPAPQPRRVNLGQFAVGVLEPYAGMMSQIEVAEEQIPQYLNVFRQLVPEQQQTEPMLPLNIFASGRFEALRDLLQGLPDEVAIPVSQAGPFARFLETLLPEQPSARLTASLGQYLEALGIPKERVPEFFYTPLFDVDDPAAGFEMAADVWQRHGHRFGWPDYERPQEQEQTYSWREFFGESVQLPIAEDMRMTRDEWLEWAKLFSDHFERQPYAVTKREFFGAVADRIPIDDTIRLTPQQWLSVMSNIKLPDPKGKTYRLWLPEPYRIASGISDLNEIIEFDNPNDMMRYAAQVAEWMERNAPERRRDLRDLLTLYPDAQDVIDEWARRHGGFVYYTDAALGSAATDLTGFRDPQRLYEVPEHVYIALEAMLQTQYDREVIERTERREDERMAWRRAEEERAAERFGWERDDRTRRLEREAEEAAWQETLRQWAREDRQWELEQREWIREDRSRALYTDPNGNTVTTVQNLLFLAGLPIPADVPEEVLAMPVRVNSADSLASAVERLRRTFRAEEAPDAISFSELVSLATRIYDARYGGSLFPESTPSLEDFLTSEMPRIIEAARRLSSGEIWTSDGAGIEELGEAVPELFEFPQDPQQLERRNVFIDRLWDFIRFLSSGYIDLRRDQNQTRSTAPSPRPVTPSIQERLDQLQQRGMRTSPAHTQSALTDPITGDLFDANGVAQALLTEHRNIVPEAIRAVQESRDDLLAQGYTDEHINAVLEALFSGGR